MTLGKKTSAVLILVMAASTLTYFLVFKFIILESFMDLDMRHAQKNMERCEAALAREIKHLNAFTHDWSSWDDTCRFVEGTNAEYIRENLPLQTFEDQKLNLVAIYDSTGRLVWGRSCDPAAGRDLGLDLAVELDKSALRAIVDQHDAAGYTSGVISTRYGVMLISSNPVLTSLNEGPSRGALVMGRLFSTELLSMLSEQVGVELAAWPTGAADLPQGIADMVRELSGGSAVKHVKASQGLMHSYSLIRDVRGRPALVLRASIPREIMRRGASAYTLGLLFVMGTGALIFLSVSLMLRVMILKPLSVLEHKAMTVSESGGAAGFLETDRSDEIGSLAREFSAMVSRLDTSQEELKEHRDALEGLIMERTAELSRTNELLRDEIEERKRTGKALSESEEKYQTHFSLTNDVLYVIDPEFRVASVSPSVETALGYRPDELVGKAFQDLGILHPDDLDQAASDTLNVLAGGKVESAVYRFFTKEGMLRYGEASGVPLVRDGRVEGVISVARDITETRRVMEALRESEEKYRTILESIEETYFELDLKGSFTFFSDPLCKALGYSRDELTGMSYRAIIAPAYLDEIFQVFHDIYLTGRPKTFVNFQVMTKDGDLRSAELSTSQLRNAAGEAVGFRGIWRDVSERIQAEQAIKESEQRYRRITSSITGYIFTVHVEGGTAVRTVHGPACEAVTGYTPEELEADGYLWFHMVAEDDRQRVQDHAARILEGENVGAIEHRIRRRDGAMRWVVNTPVLHHDGAGALVSFDGVISDITERKQAEDALRKSEERYRITLQSMPDAVSIVSVKDGRYRYVNDGFVAMTGYDTEETLGRTAEDLSLPAQDKDRQAMILAIGSKEGAHSIGACIRKKDSTLLDTLISARPVHYEGEDCMVVVLTDFTALKKAEEQKKELEMLLGQAQKMEAIGTLAGGIAHDFNNILTAIIGYTGMALHCISDPARATKMLQEAVKASERARDLVSQILAFSRKSETKYTNLALHEAVRESMKMLRSLIPTTVEIRQGLLEEVHVMGDSTKIHQIMMNLCTNAAQSMCESGGILEVGLRRAILDDAAVRPTGLQPGPHARLTVSDTGHGMPPEVVERIFEPYFTTKEMGRGTGLGLSVVHGIVKSHKGAITCSSEQGKGTVFEIYLPEIEPAHELAVPEKDQAGPAGSGRILFVDDEPIMVEVVEEMLQGLGYGVVCTTSSMEALKRFQESPDGFDLVITDMTMPAMTGDRLAARLMEIRPDIPVILCTGYSELINEEKAYAMGIREFIMKPLDIRKLGDAIRRVMDVRETAEEVMAASFG